MRFSRKLLRAGFILACLISVGFWMIWVAKDSKDTSETKVSVRERLSRLRSAAHVRVANKALWSRDNLHPKPISKEAPKRLEKAQGAPPKKIVPAAFPLPFVDGGNGKKKADPMKAMPQPKRYILIDGVPAHPTRIVAQLAEGSTGNAFQATLNKNKLRVASKITAGGTLVLDAVVVPPGEGEMDAGNTIARIKSLRESNLVAYAEPDYLLARTRTPNDAACLDGRLWGLSNKGQDGGKAGVDIGVINAWTLITGDIDVVIAVIDTGIRYTHFDLSGQMWRNPSEIPGNGVDDDRDGYIDNVFGIDVANNDGDPMDDNGHGTHCAGTIGAESDNGHPHVGVARQVRLMACKHLSADGWGYTSGAVKCIYWSVDKGAKILSNSWSGGRHSRALYEAIGKARSKGVLFVAAAGNDGLNIDEHPQYPAAYDLDNIVSVAAIDRNGEMPRWSNYGRKTVDLAAPGVWIYSTSSANDSAYTYLNGTSMATPHVAGVAALVLAARPTMSVTALRNQLVNTAAPLSVLDAKTISGGIIYAPAALGMNLNQQLVHVPVAPTIVRSSSPEIAPRNQLVTGRRLPREELAARLRKAREAFKERGENRRPRKRPSNNLGSTPKWGSAKGKGHTSVRRGGRNGTNSSGTEAHVVRRRPSGRRKLQR